MTTTSSISAPGSDRKVTTWRDVLKIHPAALEYLRLSAAELI
ncbi:MAG: hypothetical protein ACXWJU_07085 [Hyphomicrobium sp.]